jgi:nitrogen regulatory protein PII
MFLAIATVSCLAKDFLMAGRVAFGSEDAMKLIHGMVRAHKIDDVKNALSRLNVGGVVLTDVKDCSAQKHPTGMWMGHAYNLGFTPKVVFELVVHDEDADQVVRAVICAARTGCLGDGEVSVIPLEHRYDIRTGERNAPTCGICYREAMV